MGAVGKASRLPPLAHSLSSRYSPWTARTRIIRRSSTLSVPCFRRTPITALSAPTQQQTEWNVVSVLENRQVCEGHRLLVVNVGVFEERGSLIDTYRVPGMFVKLRSGDEGKPGFFAISCAPNLQGVFEFLVKDSEGTKWMEELKEGQNIQISPVMGKGFPMDRLDPRNMKDGEQKVQDVLLFATGSGIAPIRAAIESVLNGLAVREKRKVTLFYGCKTKERMAYSERLDLWRKDGVEVVEVLSQGDENWGGKKGYVQDALKEAGVDSPKETAALLCGVKGMVEDVREYLVSVGVREDRILLNF